MVGDQVEVHNFLRSAYTACGSGSAKITPGTNIDEEVADFRCAR
jgi:hypothetical protein